MNSDIKNYERLLPDNCSINIVESLVKLSMKLHSNTNWKQNFTEHVNSLPPKYCRTRWDSVYELIRHFLKNVESFKTFLEVTKTIEKEGFLYLVEKDIITTTLLLRKKKKRTHLLCKKQKDETYTEEIDMKLKVNQHYTLPSDLDYLLNINVTTVNSG